MDLAVNFRDIMEVDEKKGLMTVELSTWLTWWDSRVTSNPKKGKDYVHLNAQAMEYFWIPDIHIDQVCKIIFNVLSVQTKVVKQTCLFYASTNAL